MFTAITSADDPRVSDYVSIRERRESQAFLIAESAPVVERLLTTPYRLRSFLFTPKGYERMRAMAESAGATIYVAEPEVMQAITGFDLHRGVLASANRRPMPSLNDILGSCNRIVVLEGSNDHENIGAIARTARALGFDALVLDPSCADPFYRRSIRVSMGEILHLPVARCTEWPQALVTMAQRGFETWALTPDATAESLFAMQMPAKVALVAGAEGPGLTMEARERTHYDVRIPMHRGVDSINIGHALAVAMAAVSPPVS